MKSTTFFKGLSAKVAAIVLMGFGITGCYKNDGLDVNKPGDGTVIPDAAYSISGNVADNETGEAVDLSAVEVNKGSVTLSGNGSFNVSLLKADVPAEGVVVNLTFKAEGYKDAVRSVYVEQIPDGSTVVYPLNVMMGKDVAPVEYVDVVYDLDFVVKNSETGEAVSGITPSVEGTPDSDGNYAAGDYVVTTDEVADQFYASTTVISLPKMQVVKGEDNVMSRIIEITVTPMTVVEPDPEYVRIYGEVRDSRGLLAEAQSIRLVTSDVEGFYQTDNFSFVVRRDAAASYKVVAEVNNATETGVLEASMPVQITDAESYYVVIAFPFAVENGKEIAGDDATGTISPDVDEDGTVQGDTELEMSDGTIVLLEDGTETNLENGETIILKRNKSEEENPSDDAVVLRSYIGLPDGTTFNPGIKIKFEDEFEGQLGNAFALQYLGQDKTWANDTENGNVTVVDGRYVMDVRHFSTFRAAMNVTPEINEVPSTDTETIEIGRMNNSDQALENFKLTYNGMAGSRYVDYAKLESDIKAAFSNVKAQEFVMAYIKSLCPDVALDFVAKEYVGYATIPAYTLLISADVTTTTVVASYSFEINGKTISFDVETIKSVVVSVDEKNMEHIGHYHTHGHGHGHGDLNNAGGGIIINE